MDDMISRQAVINEMKDMYTATQQLNRLNTVTISLRN